MTHPLYDSPLTTGGLLATIVFLLFVLAVTALSLYRHFHPANEVQDPADETADFLDDSQFI